MKQKDKLIPIKREVKGRRLGEGRWVERVNKDKHGIERGR